MTDRKRPVPRLITVITGEDMTKQADKDAADINKIVARALRTGMMPISTAKALYADVSSVTDYQQAMELQTHAQEQFDALPVEIRNRFDNDPSKFLAYAEDPENKKEIIKTVTGADVKNYAQASELGEAEGSSTLAKP